MADMLVKLYDLTDHRPLLRSLEEDGVVIRRALPPEKHIVVDWIRDHFGAAWASECQVSFGKVPVSCYIAIEDDLIIGFGCYEATCKNFFGPTGVEKDARGRGIGKALLLACLDAMKADGYAYAIIGGAGPVDFYRKHVGAIPIDNSSPGIYRGMLRSK